MLALVSGRSLESPSLLTNALPLLGPLSSSGRLRWSWSRGDRREAAVLDGEGRDEEGAFGR